SSGAAGTTARTPASSGMSAPGRSRQFLQRLHRIGADALDVLVEDAVAGIHVAVPRQSHLPRRKDVLAPCQHDRYGAFAPIHITAAGVWQRLAVRSAGLPVRAASLAIRRS